MFMRFLKNYLTEINEEDEGQFVSLVNDGAFIEDIAEAMGRSVNSIRGKALSLLRAGEINAIPKQKETKGSSKADPLAGVDIDGKHRCCFI